MDEFKLCVVIPCCNHALPLKGVLTRLDKFACQCIVVNDGSDEANRRILLELQKSRPGLVFIELYPNRGKGGAMLAGFEKALELGFTHVLQLDADGQHDTEKLPEFIRAAREHPHSLISGFPLYDLDVPPHRVYGRKITNFWAAVETCSLELKECMCGFRVYPLVPSLEELRKLRDLRMTTDIELMVRLNWRGIHTIYIDIKVIYPEGGTSNFRMLRDNVQIFKIHTRLCLMMPWQMLKKLRRLSKPDAGVLTEPGNDSVKNFGVEDAATHWAGRRECPGLWGMKFMFWVYRLFGRKLFNVILYPVTAGYWLGAVNARRSSRQWLEAVNSRRRQLALRARAGRSTTRPWQVPAQPQGQFRASPVLPPPRG